MAKFIIHLAARAIVAVEVEAADQHTAEKMAETLVDDDDRLEPLDWELVNHEIHAVKTQS